jgi:hypothetical protein
VGFDAESSRTLPRCWFSESQSVCLRGRGATTQQSSISFARILVAGVALVPVAVFVLGLGTLALGIVSRYAGAVAYDIVARSFLLALIGSAINANGWPLTSRCSITSRPHRPATPIGPAPQYSPWSESPLQPSAPWPSANATSQPYSRGVVGEQHRTTSTNAVPVAPEPAI